MKTKQSILMAASLLLLPLTGQASETVENYLSQFQGKLNQVVPLEVLAPQSVAAAPGSEVRVLLTVNTKGQPEDIQVIASDDAELAASVRKAITHWRFSPAIKNGQAVASKVIIPFRVMPGYNSYAMN